MRRIAIAGIMIMIVSALFFAFSALHDGGGEGGAGGDDGWKIGVVVTIPPQAEFVRRVGGENVAVEIMIPPGENPHVYEPEPSRLINLSRASIYVMLGSGMEFERIWMDRILSLNREMLVVNCSEGVDLIRSEGGVTDPHIWLSPRNVKMMVRNICDGLIRTDPANRSYYEENMNAYISALEELDRHLADTLSRRECRKLLVYHPAWAYFARDYGLEQISVEMEGKEPTPEGITRIIDVAKREGIDTVFISPQFSTDAAEVIADAIGGNVVVIDPLAENYIENMRRIAAVIAAS